MSWWATQGLKTWVWQRLSAVYLAAYLIGFFWILLRHMPVSYALWHDWFTQPLISVATAGFFVALAVHVWVGIRDVVFDYIKPYSYRLLILGAVVLSLVLMLLWAFRILLLAVK